MMTEDVKGIDYQERLGRIRRDYLRSLKVEKAMVAATGAMPPAWTVKVVSLESYNLYNVQLVNISEPGMTPTPVTGGIMAYNIGESFTQAGTVPAGTYAVMWRAGNCNVFYIKP